MKIDPSGTGWELHNLVVDNGYLQTRPGLVSLKTPTSGATYVAGFTVESPSTTEPWHYLFEQATGSGLTTLRVYTEEFTEVFNQDIGILKNAPVVTYGVFENQLMINSPSFSAPLYGVVGGGLVTAIKTPSKDPDTTALDIPPGFVCTFGDRLPIAYNGNVYFNDPEDDPRSYVAANQQFMDGNIYDLFQGPDGALYVFTSQNTHVIPQDALGKGQIVSGFISTLPGLNPSNPRNAATSNGVICCLSKTALVLVNQGQQPIDLAPYKGRRYWSLPVEQQDYRQTGQLFPTSNGLVLSHGTTRPYFLVIDFRNKFRSYFWSKAGTPFNLVGTLKSRDGDDIYLLKDRVVQPIGNADFDGNVVRGVACGAVANQADHSPRAIAVTVQADNVGQATVTYLAGVNNQRTLPTKFGDVVIGTSTWSASTPLRGRETRTVRHQLAQRDTDIHVEVGIEGAARRLALCDLEFQGQGARRRDLR